MFYAGDVVEKGNIQAVSQNSRISFWLELDSLEEIAVLESNLISTGSVSLVALHKTFWESHYAKVQDRFGIVWELNVQIHSQAVSLVHYFTHISQTMHL